MTGTIQRKCQTCKFWVRYMSENMATPSQNGTCHRNPPQKLAEFPHTKQSDWCGEHQFKPGRKQ